MTVNRMTRVYAVFAGGADFCTGLGLVCVPQVVLPLMGLVPPAGEALVFLRWVGVFVGTVGACYWWGLLRPAAGLRAMLELTLLFRVAVGLFGVVAILRGWLAPVWASVPATDLALAAAQGWLLRKGAGHDD